MKVLVLYKPQSEHSRATEAFHDDFSKVYPDIMLDLMDVDSVEGVTKAELYDILEYPAIMIISNDGQLIKAWIGTGFPSSGEVASYFVK